MNNTPLSGGVYIVSKYHTILVYIVPAECPSDPIEECSTCCCTSSDNVEFFNPDAPELECTAPPAIYDITVVYTWSETCHPDYYFDDSQWFYVGISHLSLIRVWDACMNNLSEGVLTFSQTGDRSKFVAELLPLGIAGERLDFFRGSAVSDDTSTDDFVLDKFQQYVSVISRQVPSPDYIVGVTDLRLCDGDKWRETVKVCMELFSTGANSVADDMERNSVQANNCSFGYFEFNLKRISVSRC